MAALISAGRDILLYYGVIVAGIGAFVIAVNGLRAAIERR